MKCVECGAELASGAKFCHACGTQVGLKRNVFQVSGEKLIERFREITKDASVKKVIVEDDKGKVLLSIPMTWGAAGAVATLALAPWLAALEVIAGIVTRCTLEVERTALDRHSRLSFPNDSSTSRRLERVGPIDC